MKYSHRFIDPAFLSYSRRRDCLAELKIEKLSDEVLLKDYVLPFPLTLNDGDWKHLKPLINAISSLTSSRAVWQNILPIIKRSKIAADGSRKLRVTSELYDREDQIFISAFRNQQETRFVDESLETHRSFWLKVGLHHRVDYSISAGDYLECLQVMAARLSAQNSSGDLHLVQDIQNVLSPMTTPTSNTRTFLVSDWTPISFEKVFQSRMVFAAEPQYRQNTMASVAAGQRLLCLQEVISSEYIAVCWSQTAFPVHQPTKEVLSMVPWSGKPLVNMVLGHLMHLKGVAQEIRRHQLSDFLDDLSRTYEYLQDQLAFVSTAFNLQDSEIWLNLDSLDPNTVVMDEFKSSWHKITDLFLSRSCDAGSMRAVRPGLMRYEKLLRGLGCKSIIYGTVNRPALKTGSKLADGLQKQWQNEELVDITYSTEGRLIKAHRVVLAAVSKKCAAQFSDRWPRENLIKYDETTDPDDYLSYHTLSTMIKFAYEAEINWEQMQVTDADDADNIEAKLYLLLDLHQGADCWNMEVLRSQVEDQLLENRNVFLNLKNIIEIRERADRAGAKEFERSCATFIEQNRDAVEKVHGVQLQ
jgi:sacsin